MSIKTVYAVDPGINIGFARLDAQDKEIIRKQYQIIDKKMFHVYLAGMEDMARDLQGDQKLTIVAEDFLLFGHKAKAQIGSRMDASKIIGAIEYAVFRAQGKMELIMQPASVLDTAATWSGVGTQYVGRDKHMPDNLSAYNHGYFYMIQKGFIKHRSLDDIDLEV